MLFSPKRIGETDWIFYKNTIRKIWNERIKTSNQQNRKLLSWQHYLRQKESGQNQANNTQLLTVYKWQQKGFLEDNIIFEENASYFPTINTQSQQNNFRQVFLITEKLLNAKSSQQLILLLAS